MGTDATEVVETLPPPHAIKVHRLMCTELMKLVDRVEKVFPEIEEARPRCSSGIQALCLLNNAIHKAKLLLRYCSESSKLYLALTGDVILSRCKKARNLLEQSLSQIQNMVPVILAVEISRIIADLRGATFSLDPSEEETGKVVKTLLQQHASARDSIEESVMKAIQNAALRLHITSQTALLVEKRAIRKLIDKVDDGESAKKQILLFLLIMLKKCEKSIVRGQMESSHVQYEGSFSLANSYDQAVETESRINYGPNEAQADMMSRPMPPEEFKCPLSLGLMYDPVVIASGQSFERMWIQKWFDEGHDTCPKTKRKLTHLSLMPNAVMKDLISKWCAVYGLTIPDPCMQSAALDTSFTSIASLSSSMNDLSLPIDFSNVSIGSLDTSHCSNSSRVKITDGIEREMNFLQKLDALPWESQCKAVEDVKTYLKQDDQACQVMSPENLVEPLVGFLNDALDLRDVKAQRTGCMLLFALASKCSSSISKLHKGAYGLLASFLDSEVTEEALAIVEVLSRYRYCRSKIVESGALTCIIKLLETERRDFQELAIKILYNLSLNSDISSLIVSSEFIPKLVPFFDDASLASYCIAILKKLCDKEDAWVSVVETDGCIASVARLLETDSHEDQENAVYVLLSLCSQRDQYCQLIMKEGVIPALVSISINGNDNGKIGAMEVLRLLRSIEYNDMQECPVSNLDCSRDCSYQSKEKKSSSKGPGFFGKISLFSKPSSLAPRKKK